MNAQVKVRLKAKRCPCCGGMKDVSEFNRNRARTDGLQDQCRACHAPATRRNRRLQFERDRAAALAARAKWADIARWNAMAAE